jgi:hypothetical protein
MPADVSLSYYCCFLWVTLLRLRRPSARLTKFLFHLNILLAHQDYLSEGLGPGVKSHEGLKGKVKLSL